MLDDTTNEYASSLPYYEYSTVTDNLDGTNMESMSAEQKEVITPLPEQPPTQNGQQRSRDKVLYSIIGILCAILVIIAGSTALLLYTRPVSIAPVKIAVNLPSGTVTGSAVSQFRYGTCPFQPAPGIIEGQQVRCGTLVVPEDRSHPQGKTVQLAVAIFYPAGADASSSPELY